MASFPRANPMPLLRPPTASSHPVLLGQRVARSSDAEPTVFKSTGHAVEDTAAARVVYARAKADGLRAGERF